MIDPERVDRFGSDGMEGISFADSICHDCKHVRDQGETCDAFPDGIPMVIRTGEFDHHKSYPDDDGITFEEV